MSAGGVLDVASLCREQTPHVQATAMQLSELQLDFSESVRALRKLGAEGVAAALKTQRDAVAAALLALSRVNTGLQAVEHATAEVSRADSLQVALAALTDNEVDLGAILHQVTDAQAKVTGAVAPTKAVMGCAGPHEAYSGRTLIEGLNVVATKLQQLDDDLRRILVENRLVINVVEDVGNETP